MKRFNKKYPLWLHIKGTDIRKATLCGVDQYLRTNGLKYCVIITTQNGEEINHPLNNTVHNLIEED